MTPLQLPYLHWDTIASTKAYTEFLKQRHNSEITHPHPLPAFEQLAGPFRSYHPRRTLDQYYYSRLEDTSERDNDQVVSKQTMEAPGGATMVMVDQLWLSLWLSIQQSEDIQLGEPSTIVTSFPFTAYARPAEQYCDYYARLDILYKVLGAYGMEIAPDHYPIRTPVRAVDVAAEVLTNTLTGMLSFRENWFLDFLELFREALNNITEHHSNFLRVFVNSISSSTPRISNDRKTEKFHQDLQKEFRLSLEVADIIGELHMLKQLLKTQISALHEAREQIERLPDISDEMRGALGPLHQKILELPSTIRTNYLAQVKGMIEDADRAQKDILNLLDLQQKQDNIDEAHSSNQTALLTAKQAMSAQDQADATDAQSQILFLFTFVTIVFLPLSFLTSYYGMNVRDHNDNQILRNTSYIWKVMGGSSFPITTLFLLGSAAFYVRSKRQAKKNRIEDLADLKKNDALPSGLFKTEDPMYQEIEQRAGEMREEEKGRSLITDHRSSRLRDV